jgi:hypothetical protein
MKYRSALTYEWQTKRGKLKDDPGFVPYGDRLDQALLGAGLLPSQFPTREPADQPVVNLWLAAMQLAVSDLNPPPGVKCRINRTIAARHAVEARQWVEHTGDCVGSFNWVAAALNVDPDALRAKLLNNHDGFAAPPRRIVRPIGQLRGPRLS